MKTSQRIVILCSILIVGFGIIYFTRTNETEPVIPDVTPSGEPTFEWTYAPFEEKEIPRTTIGLIARYPNGVTQTKEIDTIQGGCNDYSDPDGDVYPKSTMIICYYAGLGHYYKIIQSEGTYRVQRKIFEEATPEYTPPKLPFETVAQF